MSTLGASARRIAAASLERFRRRGRSSLAHVVRLTAAAVASYVVASLVFPTSKPLLAPLSALLIVQLTPVSILKSGLQRVISVVAGVAIAVTLSAQLAITWWSLAGLIAISLVIGQILRLGDNLLEVPISAMLVLGVGSRSAETAAWKRIGETLVGAGVGVAANLLFPPKVSSEDAATEIEAFARDLATLLDRAASGMADDPMSMRDLEQRAWTWLGDARRLTHDIPNVGTALLRAEESRRLNLRALAMGDSGPGLRLGLEALEHSAIAMRSLLRAIVQTAHDLAEQNRTLPPDVRQGVIGVLAGFAGALTSYGALVRAESHPADASVQHQALQEALSALRDAQERHFDALLVDPRHDSVLAGLGFSARTTVERVLQELSLEERSQRQVRRPPTLPPLLLPRPRTRHDRPARALPADPPSPPPGDPAADTTVPE